MSKNNITQIRNSVNTFVTGLLSIPISVDSSIAPEISTETIIMDHILVPTIVSDSFSTRIGETIPLNVERVSLKWEHEEDGATCGTLELSVSMELNTDKETALLAADYRLNDLSIDMHLLNVDVTDGTTHTVKIHDWDLEWKDAS